MQLKLHTETSGRGTDLFLVHGWSLHGGVWSSVLPELARSYRVTCVDLPGHGHSREVPMPMSLAALGQLLVDVAPESAVWLGWSLGGLACMRAAVDYPERVRALVLVSATPRFITAADWLPAMPASQLQEFADELSRDCHKAVQRFLSLQARGGDAARVTLRQLRETMSTRDEPQPSSLAQGLKLLHASDLRSELHGIRMPTLVMSGERDRLTPPQAATFLAAGIDGAKLVKLPHAAHAPFLSHPAEFMAALNQFVRETIGIVHA